MIRETVARHLGKKEIGTIETVAGSPLIGETIETNSKPSYNCRDLLVDFFSNRFSLSAKRVHRSVKFGIELDGSVDAKPSHHRRQPPSTTAVLSPNSDLQVAV